MAATQESTAGTGWVTYAGIMLVLVGVSSIIDGIWAFRYDDTITDLVLFEDDLATWGWIWLISGIVIVLAGVGVFNGAQWARWTGVVVAGYAVLANLSWAQIQPTQGLIGMILSSLVIYGLAAHGGTVRG